MKSGAFVKNGLLTLSLFFLLMPFGNAFAVPGGDVGAPVVSSDQSAASAVPEAPVSPVVEIPAAPVEALAPAQPVTSGEAPMPPPLPAMSKETETCVDCHKEETVEYYEEWKRSKHSNANVGCYECHKADPSDTNAKRHKKFSITVAVPPETCGGCHERELSLYQTSVHAAEHKRFLGNERKNDAAVCSSCHTAHRGPEETSHDIASPKEDQTRLMITENCGGCHKENYKTYKHTYHGQVGTLGYAHIAKCFDCHGDHAIQRVTDPRSMVHPDNRLKTCQKCHENATKGFASFYPHGNTHDLKKYPYMWIASKFMILLLAGVFTISWLHCALWFYREHKDRRFSEVRIKIEKAKEDPVHVKRFSGLWRWAHLILAIAVMVLVLTGTTVLYADSFWAPTVMKLLGGAKIAAIIHRIAAMTFIVLFFGHLFVVFYNVYIKKRGEKFRWFGPYSLLPRWQDLEDIFAMCRWFVGKGPRPTFDHWTYWEKFDYWAPFWGMFAIGLTGAMLWLRDYVADVMPGWVFNIATIVHGEEAFLAAVFLFTVHYFNCHFRPDKFPQDIVMFTGTMPLEEFKHERGVEYQRLVESGELEALLVKSPTKGSVVRSKILGAILLIICTILLVLVLIGFWQGILAK